MSEEALQQLLDGQVVPVKHVDFQHQLPTRSGGFMPNDKDPYKPIVKRTVTYIVMGLVFDDKGHMILIQEAKQSCRGLWYIPAGRVEPGENLIDGMKREVLEEAGVEVQPLSLISVTHRAPDSTRIFMKFFYLNKVIGGKLKTLAEKDEESLQAKWFTMREIMSGSILLRHKDFFESMERAIWYRSQTDVTRHPALQVGIQVHEYLLHRMVIVKQEQDGSLEVFCNMEKGCLPCIKISPRSTSLDDSLQAAVIEAFGVKEAIASVTVRGILTLEHCGIPAREHDGLCITTATVISEDDHKLLGNGAMPDYQWNPISNSDLLASLKDRISSNKKLIKLFQK